MYSSESSGNDCLGADSARCMATACTEAGDTIVADSCLSYPASNGHECDEHTCTAGCPSCAPAH